MTLPTRIRAFYLLYFVGIGINLPFFAPYLRGLGFSGRQIGTAQMIGALTAAPAGIIWAVVTDRLRAVTPALRLATTGVLCAAFLLPWVHTPATVAAVLVLQGLSMPAITPLVDSLAVETARETHTSYSRLRLFGSLGYVAGALLLGVALAARGDRAGDPLVPLALLACAIGYTITAAGFPRTPAAGGGPHPSAMLGLLRDRTLPWVLAAGVLHTICTFPYYQLFGVLVREHGLSAAVTGTGSTVGVLAEIAVLLLYPRIEQRFSTGTILAVAFGAGAIRWSLLSIASSATAIIALQVFHGLSFGLYWAATIKLMSRIVPPALRTTGQALYGAVCFSLGGAIGSQLSGICYDAFGAAAPVYRLAAIGELLPFGIALLLRARDRSV
jgi:PPP family 3-phenylpropionic acid transporter